jgi:hypothetical protein
MADKTNPSSRREADSPRRPPEAEVGITNRDLDAEDASLRRMERHGRQQQSGDAPIGTHEGITRDELAEGRVHAVDPGPEAERGGDRANKQPGEPTAG